MSELYLLTPKKVSKFTEQDYQSLYKFLIGLCKVSGIEAPDDVVLKVCVQFIRENFFDFSKEEIEKAFNLLYSQKLPVDDANHYGKLSIPWIGKVLNAYKDLRAKELIEYNRISERIKNERSRDVSQKEADKIMAEAIVSHYENFKETNKFFDLGNSVYNWLESKMLISYSVEQKKFLMKEARKLITDKQASVDNTDLFSRAVSFKEGDFESLVKSEAKTLGVIKYFENLKKNEINLKSYFGKYLK